MKNFRFEIVLYLLAASLAAVFRLTQLGSIPLGNLEASQALQALKLFEGSNSPVSSSPLNLGLTGFIYYMFGSSNTAARLIPAVLGIFLVFAPLLFKDRLGKGPAVILAFFLAVDPFLIFLSREAGSGMMAIFSVIFFLGVFLKGYSTWSGIFGTLSILSGPMAFPGIAAISLSAIWGRSKASDVENGDERRSWNKTNWKTALIAAGITILIAGLVFLKAPFLINGVGSVWVETIIGWNYLPGFTSQDILIKFIISILFLVPLAFLLGITGMVRGALKKNQVNVFFMRWALIALGIILIYPAHRVTDLAWVSIPLWAASSQEINLWVHKPTLHKSVSYIFAAVCSVLFIFCGLKITNLLAYEPGSADYQLALAGIALTLLMLAVAAFLIGWGWSRSASFFGLGIGMMVILSVFTLNMSRRAANLGSLQAANILNPGPIPLENELLVKTMNDISLQNKGITGDLDVSVIKLTDSNLTWAIRDFSNTSFVSSLAKNETPELVITSANELLELPASYRGQDFVQAAEIPWSLLTWKEWLKWLIFGEAPTQKQFIVLWARNDLFPLGDSEIPNE